MVDRTFPDVHLVVHKPGLPPVDDPSTRARRVSARILNVPGHFVSLRPRSELCKTARVLSTHLFTALHGAVHSDLGIDESMLHTGLSS